jgi:hypothetical protein
VIDVSSARVLLARFRHNLHAYILYILHTFTNLLSIPSINTLSQVTDQMTIRQRTIAPCQSYSLLQRDRHTTPHFISHLCSSSSGPSLTSRLSQLRCDLPSGCLPHDAEPLLSQIQNTIEEVSTIQDRTWSTTESLHPADMCV